MRAENAHRVKYVSVQLPSSADLNCPLEICYLYGLRYVNLGISTSTSIYFELSLLWH